jgi:hypothetical protein
MFMYDTIHKSPLWSPVAPEKVSDLSRHAPARPARAPESPMRVPKFLLAESANL